MTNGDLTGANAAGHADRRWAFEGLGLTIVIVALAILFTAINPRFASVTNFVNILTQASFIIVMAAGMTFVITSAGIDLSVGSAAALITVVAFGLIKGGMNPALGVLVMFALGAFLGGLTGVLIAVVKIPPFIATLGMMAALRGLALVHSAGEMHFGLPASPHLDRPGLDRGRPGAGGHLARLRRPRRAPLQPQPVRPPRAGRRRQPRGRPPRRRAGEPGRGHGLRADGARHRARRPHHDDPDRFDPGHDRHGHGDPRDLRRHHRRHQPVRGAAARSTAPSWGRFFCP